MIGDTWQEGVKILEVGMGFIMEVGQQPGQCQYFLQGPGEGPEEAAGIGVLRRVKLDFVV